MPIESDPDDVSFMQGMKALLGFKPDAVNELLSKMRADDLIELADAVTNKDKAAAVKIIKDATKDEDIQDKQSKINPLFDRTHDQEEIGETEDYETQPLAADVVLNIGDKVISNKQQATVRIPRGPGGTIGLMIGGKLKMVDQSEIDRVDESVLGMSMMPSLNRLRELAGMRPMPQTFEVEQVMTDPPVEVQQVESDPVACAMAGIDQLETALPNIKLGDLKMVRQRVNNIIMKMNESAGLVSNKSTVAEGRKLKR